MLRDSKQRHVGSMQFAQLWTPMQEAEARAQRALDKAQDAASAARISTVFWSVLGVFFVAAWIVYLSKGSNAAQPS